MKRFHFCIRNAFFIFISLILFSVCTYAADLKVSADGSARFETIQSAVDSAVNGDVVIVANGEYTGDGNTGIDFKGKAITVRSENGPENCIIDCKKSGRAFIFYHNETGTSAVSGFTVINANNADGGAIRCGKYDRGTVYEAPRATEETGSPSISNCIFRNNYSDYAGAAIIINTSSPVISGCVFENNSAKQYGGAIAFMNEANPKIINCSFINNSAYSGGAIHAEESEGELAGLYISDNNAEYDGAGICIRESRVTVDRCRILGNKSYWGAGISVKTTSGATIRSCLVAENEGERGGGISVRKSEAVISGCTITSNSGHGGNNPFKGIGGIYFEETSPEINNSIIWGNSDGDIGTDEDMMVALARYSNIGGGYSGEGIIDVDPMFTGNGDYHVTTESPCLSAGNAAYSPILDLENKTRAEDGIHAMGAYETPVVGGRNNTEKGGSSGSGCFINSVARVFDISSAVKTITSLFYVKK